MNDVPTAECGSEYNPNNSAKVVSLLWQINGLVSFAAEDFAL